MNANPKIIRALQEANLSNEYAGVIRVVGGTDKFHSSPACRALADEFNRLKTEVSTYAIVLPFYEWTLKGLLEDGAKQYAISKSTLEECLRTNAISEEQIKKLQSAEEERPILEKAITEATKETELQDKLKAGIVPLTGYDLLERMTFEERIATMLPLLKDITQGVKALYIAKLNHHDIKPANIFVNAQGRKLEAVLGDLGFLQTPNIEPSHSMNLHDELPLGTRHYRSPDQKDYFDMCYAKVEYKSIENSEQKTLRIVVEDRKFSDTLIEPGDELMFSKDPKRDRYTIKQISPEKGYKVIYLDGDQTKKNCRRFKYPNHIVQKTWTSHGSLWIRRHRI